MARIWIVSALVVAAAVTLVIVFTGDPAAPKSDGDTKLRPPAPLSERELRVYMDIQPKLDLQMRKAADRAVTAARQGEQVEADVRPWLELALKRHNMVLSDWVTLSERVEFVVGVLRWTRDKPGRDADLEAEIAKQEALVEGSEGTLKEKLLKRLDQLKERRKAVARPLRESDKKLAARFWKTLDQIVPRRGPS